MTVAQAEKYVQLQSLMMDAKFKIAHYRSQSSYLLGWQDGVSNCRRSIESCNKWMVLLLTNGINDDQLEKIDNDKTIERYW